MDLAAEILKYKKENNSTWPLPQWGHPLSQLALPLFITHNETYIPIGTAFWVGPKVNLVITASHNIHEAVRRDMRYEHALAQGRLPPHLDLRVAGLCVLHACATADGNVDFSFIPLRTVAAAPPTDIAIGSPEFVQGLPRLIIPVSFDPPRIGQKVWSIGYTDFKPIEGIPVNDVRNYKFDWGRYSHRLVVSEGIVEKIFIQRFTAGFVDGPCFAFSNEISHGQSGGPITSAEGKIVGLNSASASRFFGRPMSLGSLLFPCVLSPIKIVFNWGPVSFNFERTLLDLAVQKSVLSDSSERHLSFVVDESGATLIGARAPVTDKESVHDDYSGLQRGTTAEPLTGPFYKLLPAKDHE